MNAEQYGRYLYLYRRHLSVYHGNVDKVYKYGLSFIIDEQYGNPICTACNEVITDGAGWYPEEAENLAMELAQRRCSTGYWTQSLANQPDAIVWTHAFNEHGEPECIVDGWVEKRAWQIDNVRRICEGRELQLWSTYEDRPLGATFYIRAGGHVVQSQSTPFTPEDFAALGDVALDDDALVEPEPAPLFVLLIERAHPDAPGTYQDGMALKVCISDGMCYPVTLNGPSVRLSDGSILTVRASEWSGQVEAIITGKEEDNGEEAQDTPGRVAWRSRREYRQAAADDGGEGAEDV